MIEEWAMMNDLGQRAVECRGWRWMPGMRWVVVRTPPLEDISGRVHPYSVRSQPYPGALPDLTDPATLGCLLSLVREAWGDPTLSHAFGGARWGWVLPMRRGHFAPLDVWSDTEAEALVRALEAAP